MLVFTEFQQTEIGLTHVIVISKMVNRSSQSRWQHLNIGNRGDWISGYKCNACLGKAAIQDLSLIHILNKYGGYILAFNGGLIIDCATGQPVSSVLLPQQINRKIMKLAEEHRVNILTYENDTILTKKKDDPYVELEAKINSLATVSYTHLDVYKRQAMQMQEKR